MKFNEFIASAVYISWLEKRPNILWFSAQSIYGLNNLS